MADDVFDLFGHRIPEWRGKRGRPPYERTEQDANQIKLLLALGWSITRMANAISVSPATLKRYFRAELKVRDAMRDRLDARRFMIAMEQANAGNIAALRELGNMIEKNDRMEIERQLGDQSKKAGKGGADAIEPKGKKQSDRQQALDADADLMAELEQEALQNAHH